MGGSLCKTFAGRQSKSSLGAPSFFFATVKTPTLAQAFLLKVTKSRPNNRQTSRCISFEFLRLLSMKGRTNCGGSMTASSSSVRNMYSNGLSATLSGSPERGDVRGIG